VKKTAFKVHRVSVWPGRKVQACCTSLPSRMPIKENPGEPTFQSSASNGQCQTPCEHNLNYTIWTLYAESVSFPNNATLLWGVSSEINQTILRARALKSIKHFYARALKSVKQFRVRAHSHQQTNHPELRVNRRIAQPPPPTECESSCRRPIHLPINVNLPVKGQSTSH
jgi:hypothetical protein